MTTTLLAVTGLSPAIVTETLWALARRRPRLLPQRVRFITTVTGALKLEEQLFTPRPEWADRSVWETLRNALGAAPDELIAAPPDVISMADGASGRAMPLDDIRTPAENDAAAEFIFSRVWDIVRDKDRRLVASIAGGRKTMGALLHSAVSLVGREDDLITHVLVSPPFDTLPGFFFPAQPDCPLLDSRSGRSHLAADARIDLAEVPFVPLRNRFRELDNLPASFLGLRAALSARLKTDGDTAAAIVIDHHRGLLEVAGKSRPVRPRALAILHFVLRCNEKAAVPPDQKTAAAAFNARLAASPGSFGPAGFGEIGEDDFRRELNHLRALLRHAPWRPALRTLVQAPFTLEILKTEDCKT